MPSEVLLFVCAASVLFVACLVPNRWLPPLPNDKLMHFGAFAVLTVLALRAAQGRGEAGWWLAGLLLGGWLIECLQSLVPDRRFCWRDLAANAAGIATVALPAFAIGHF
ncbi:VanZ family protein [Massilia sp. UMI-21]|nr:VanZ family protein [Massilia sp. UMI-21]